MLSKRTKLSLCQFLDLQSGALLEVLFSKHGMEAPIHDMGDLTFTVMNAHPDLLHGLLGEVIRTGGDLRLRVTPRYRYDLRREDLDHCLFLDGYRIGDNQLIPIDPSVEGAEPLDDDLTTSIRESGLQQAEEIIRILDNSTAAFRGVPPDINACLTNVRVALQTIATAIADERQGSDPSSYDPSRWEEVLRYLQVSGFITTQEEKGLSGVYGFISPGAHQPFDSEDIEMARLGRNLAIGMVYFLTKRLGRNSY